MCVYGSTLHRTVAKAVGTDKAIIFFLIYVVLVWVNTMADTIPHPKMDWGHPDRPQAYKEFKQMANMWFQVKNIPAAQQHNYIILWAGREGLRIFNTWGLTDEQLQDPNNIWDKFSKHVESLENFRIHRLEFQRYKQGEHESVDEFYT